MTHIWVFRRQTVNYMPSDYLHCSQEVSAKTMVSFRKGLMFVSFFPWWLQALN